MPGLIGYARVSTGEQNTARQIDELHAAGCTTCHEEHASGGSRARPVLASLLRHLNRGDTLVVVKLDRLARSLDHLLEVVRTLEERGAFLRVPGDPIDTAMPQGRFMLQMLGVVAEFERALIRERVNSGLARAAREGRRGGNPALRARDPNVLRQLQQAREDAYLAWVVAGAGQWLSAVIRLRVEEGRSWDQVVVAVNARLGRSRTTKNGEEVAWSQARLLRAVRALVRDGLAPPEVLQGRGRGTTLAADERDGTLRAVAAILGGAPKATLSSIAERLISLRLYPPRGGTRWSTSSVAHLVTQARKRRLLQAEDG